MLTRKYFDYQNAPKFYIQLKTICELIPVTTEYSDRSESKVYSPK